MTYVLSDIHGQYTAYMAMLEKIGFSSDDSLIVLGDIVDRGPDGVKILQDIMSRPTTNIRVLAGNHELSMAKSMRWLLSEVTEESLVAMDQTSLAAFSDWIDNGGEPTLRALKKLPQAEREDILEYLLELELYTEIEVGGRTFVIVHAGLDNFSSGRPLDDYEPWELLFCRPDYEQIYFPGKFLVTGHTPTQTIPGNPNPGRIFRQNNHIAIDCGCGFGGPLAALCLDTGEEYYV